MDILPFLVPNWWEEHSNQLLPIADAIIFLLFFMFVFYLFIFALSSIGTRVSPYPLAIKKHRFAIFFPAHNEDNVILSSVRSFMEQQYPKEKYDVYVIADALQSDTIFALEEDAKVLTSTKIQTKIQAFQSAMQQIQKEKYDMVVLFNVNNKVDPNFLIKLNDAFYSGCMAIQTHRVTIPKENRFVMLNAITEEINNSIFRRGHTRLGFSSALIGSGMAFDFEWLKDNIFKIKDTDIAKELEIRLISQNIYIDFLDDIITYDEKVTELSGLYQQRTNWLSNHFHGLFHAITHLPGAIFRANWDYCDKLFQWAMPSRVILLGFISMFSIITFYLDWVTSIKWIILLIIFFLTFAISIPDKLIDRRLQRALWLLPFLFIFAILGYFRFLLPKKYR